LRASAGQSARPGGTRRDAAAAPPSSHRPGIVVALASGARPRVRGRKIFTQHTQKGWAMDFFFFFAGLFCTIAALLVIKTTSPNQH
jgi:hypothetical protein